MRTSPPALIAPFINALQELDRGDRAPSTTAQEHFVLVCIGRLSPETDYERAYLAWRSKEQRRWRLEAEKRTRSKPLGEQPRSEAQSKPSKSSPKRRPSTWREKDAAQMDREAEAQFFRMGIRNASSVPAGRWAEPKPWARFIDEPLGSRADFKRDTAANFAASRRNKL